MQTLNEDILEIVNWDTGQVTDMLMRSPLNLKYESYVLPGVCVQPKHWRLEYAFNQPIRNWSTSLVTDIDALEFNQDIGKWNT